jgi:hypothetical protein
MLWLSGGELQRVGCRLNVDVYPIDAPFVVPRPLAQSEWFESRLGTAHYCCKAIKRFILHAKKTAVIFESSTTSSWQLTLPTLSSSLKHACHHCHHIAKSPCFFWVFFFDVRLRTRS